MSCDVVHGLAHADDQSTVNDELCQFGGSLVAVTAMPDEEFRDVAELRDAEIGRQRCLSAFFAHDTATYIGGLDHAYIISTVTDTAHSLFGVFSNQLGDLGLLSGRASTSDHGRKQNSHGDEFLSELAQH
jgi:hypothetical protein